jgi:hypothetical protein
MPIVGRLDIHRKQLTFDYPDTVTGEVKRGQIAPADRAHLRAWLAQFAGRDVAFMLEGCTGWRYVAEELAGVAAHVGEPADTAAARGPEWAANPRSGPRSTGGGRPVMTAGPCGSCPESVSVSGRPRRSPAWWRTGPPFTWS